GWGVDAIYRHFDLTGKRCPDFMVVDEAARAHGLPSAAQGWDWFRAEVEVRVQCLRRGLPVPWPEPVPVRVRDRQVPGLLWRGRAFVAARALAEAVGGTVHWDAEGRSVGLELP
ncbi:MAG: hypothetical protein QHH05_09940, partial [Syntrophomonadaceae bacterium]|nr:hypothetical protein [Syntrophomonadaceae bacterium]